MSFRHYVTSSPFAADVAENWQSEYLQFFSTFSSPSGCSSAGSTESKELDNAGLESDKDQKVGPYAPDDSPRWARTRGWRTTVYSSSLGLRPADCRLLRSLA